MNGPEIVPRWVSTVDLAGGGSTLHIPRGRRHETETLERETEWEEHTTEDKEGI